MQAPAHALYDGVVHYFCGIHCKKKFELEPERWLNAPPPDRATPLTPEELAAEYTCPMHPDVRQRGPGACPICGMALESVELQLESAIEEPELREMRKLFWISAAFCVPLLVVTMGLRHTIVDLGYRQYLGPLEFVLASPVVIWAGRSFFRRFWDSLKNRHPNMFTLIGLGVGAAYGFSLVALLFPIAFPASLQDHNGELPLYFEPAAVIIWLTLLGQWLELQSRGEVTSALRALLELAPPKARRLMDDGVEEDIPTGQVRLRDRLRVRPGEKVPVDGVVLEGQSSLDESLITGESDRLVKNPGDQVIGGTINTGGGSLIIRAEKVGRETLLAHLVRLVTEAQRSRTPIQHLADKVSAYFVPAVVGIAAITAASWWIWGPEPRLGHAIINSLAVLIIACPCALGLAAPVSVMVATSRAANRGVLFRSAKAIEMLRKVDTLLVDKTGTLTEGRPRLVFVQPLRPELQDAELLGLAAAVESGSEHPLAHALLEAAKERGVALPQADNFYAFAGRGARAEVGGRSIYVGSPTLFREAGLAFPANAEAKAEDARAQGETAFFVGDDKGLLGWLAVKDPVKESTPETLAALRKIGLRIVMVSGDSKTTAQAVARELQITEVMSEVLPADKAALVKRLQAEGRCVAMAGDGVNDSPALAQADLGIAMGTGADIAKQTADIVLVKGELRGILRAREISLATVRNIRQNLFFAFIYNVLGVTVATGMFYDAFGIQMQPMAAALAMSFSSVSVIVNALRLRRLI